MCKDLQSILSHLDIDRQLANGHSEEFVMRQSAEAMDYLASLGDSVVPTLEQVVKDANQPWPVLFHAVESLGKIQSPKSLAVLVDTYRGGWGSIAGEILINLGAIAVPILIAGLTSDDPIVRMKSAWRLGRIGDEAALEPLKMIALSHDEEYVRFHAERAYLKILKFRSEKSDR